jgi:hypothetical protein
MSQNFEVMSDNFQVEEFSIVGNFTHFAERQEC